jgi:ATP-dependent protease ClpP protease subunit
MGDRVFMLLDKGIGHDEKNPFIYGSAFAEEVYYWKAQGKKITVKINCLGGSVYDGWSMIDAIIQAEADTENVGVAASMGGICLMFGKDRAAYDYATAMIHAPRGGHKQFLDVIKSQFKGMLETRTKFTIAEIDDMMDSGKDYFFTASEMLAKGIIDRIIPTGKKPHNLMVTNELSLNEAYTACNKVLSTENKNLTMSNILKNFFKSESEEAAVATAMQLKGENDTIKADLAKKDLEITALKKEVQDAKTAAQAGTAKANAEKLIADNAKKLSKMDDAAKAKLVEQATASYDLVKSIIDAMPEPAAVTKKEASAHASIDAAAKGEATYETLMNDPKAYQAMLDSDPEKVAALEKAFIEKNKK